MSLANVQTLAAHSVAAVEAGRNLSDVLAEIWRGHPQLPPQERGALQDIAYGCQRFSGSLRALLGLMLNKPLPRADIRSLILVALYQLAYSRNATHAVVNEAVRAAGKIGKGQYKALTNALLRRFLRERDNLMQQAQHSPEGRYNLPAWWLARLQQDYPNHWQQITEAFNSRPPMTLRINRRHSDAEGYLKILAEHGMQAEVLGSHAVILAAPVPVSALPLFAEGGVSVQDWGAQQAAAWLNVRNGERVLDACAAPGGKSGHLLEWANCQLTALDIDPERLQQVYDNLARLHLNAELHAADARQWASCYDGPQFDVVLADVPCTASGVVRRHPDIKWLRREQDAANTAAQQAGLLDALWQTLKPGGRMLLSTCSLFDEENGSQLQAFLQRHADASCRRSETLLPNPHQDGFYYALIDKTA
ncbi:16S rRNA (cytosine(967)-C(5))-methyltransferase RsmB [Eikenella sp. S3360]|uniref:16S rRNA (cytosine(967)-C(5))-methyltransferase n=1 Tax=Eikenella glucosivorans TaxID=2766967 RepID=A0ABS0NAZ1_9NEIS|nr:16S rRNA (cytosine(967)-C(5))-methyltransferase RsmB [Eikenella glucosivorans]MBH5329409.1 16S rRNA (cytosine(967)-C(5))-methyltransferase RsmB [Eikenella glucosivorans]